MPDTITIIDDRTGKQVTVPITDGVFPATAVRELDPSLFIYDPAFMQTAACQERDHLPRRRGRHPALPRLPDRAARRAQHLPRGRLPAAQRRAAQRRRSWRQWKHRRHPPHVHPREHAQAVRRRLPLRRPPDGHARQRDRRARHVLQRRQGHPRQGQPRQADPAPDRQDADAGGDVATASRSACRSSTRTTTSASPPTS